MNTVRAYWAGRLNTGVILYGWAENGTTHRGPWPWPDWVSRKALYEDYTDWLLYEYGPTLKRCIEPVKAAEFFHRLNRYMRPVRNTGSFFPVTVSRRSRGEWSRVTVRRKFIKLPPLEDAMAHFKFYTQALDKSRPNPYI